MTNITIQQRAANIGAVIQPPQGAGNPVLPISQSPGSNPAGNPNGSTVYSCGLPVFSWTASITPGVLYEVRSGGTVIGTGISTTTYTPSVMPPYGANTFSVYAYVGGSYSPALLLGTVNISPCPGKFAYSDYFNTTVSFINESTGASLAVVSTPMAASSYKLVFSANGKTFAIQRGDTTQKLYVIDNISYTITSVVSSFPSNLISEQQVIPIIGDFAYIAFPGGIIKFNTITHAFTQHLFSGLSVDNYSKRHLIEKGGRLFFIYDSGHLGLSGGGVKEVDLSTMTAIGGFSPGPNKRVYCFEVNDGKVFLGINEYQTSGGIITVNHGNFVIYDWDTGNLLYTSPNYQGTIGVPSAGLAAVYWIARNTQDNNMIISAYRLNNTDGQVQIISPSGAIVQTITSTNVLFDANVLSEDFYNYDTRSGVTGSYRTTDSGALVASGLSGSHAYWSVAAKSNFNGNFLCPVTPTGGFSNNMALISPNLSSISSYSGGGYTEWSVTYCQ